MKATTGYKGQEVSTRRQQMTEGEDIRFVTAGLRWLVGGKQALHKSANMCTELFHWSADLTL